MEAVDDRRLQRLQKTLATHDLLIIDELGFVPLSKTGAELLFEVISQRYERGSIIITSNLPFNEWTEVFGSERLTGAILDRRTTAVRTVCTASSGVACCDLAGGAGKARGNRQGGQGFRELRQRDRTQAPARDRAGTARGAAFRTRAVSLRDPVVAQRNGSCRLIAPRRLV